MCLCIYIAYNASIGEVHLKINSFKHKIKSLCLEPPFNTDSLHGPSSAHRDGLSVDVIQCICCILIC